MESQEIEKKRKELQINLDSLKSLKARNVLGQFSTPYSLAIAILKKAKELYPSNNKINFLDPAIGTGVFYSALRKIFQEKYISKTVGFEIDDHYGLPSKDLWRRTPLEYGIDDFCLQDFPENEDSKFNLIICNPPYVRHHHLNGQKQFLKNKTESALGIKISSLSGLYCYFVLLCHKWMTENGIAIWLIPSEFMDVNYGSVLRNYLTSKVTLLQIHRFDPNELQFKDALVTSSILIFKNTIPEVDHKVVFSLGNDLSSPNLKKEIAISDLKKEKKWTRFPQKDIRTEKDFPKLKEFFKIKRGIATGDNSFFIMAKEEAIKKNLPFKFLRPILPSPRYISTEIINSDELGNPDIEKKLFVLDCKESIEAIKNNYPNLYLYLEEGISKKVTERYICRKRKIWYSQENREISDFFFTYIGREKNGINTFRFILNDSNSIVNNSYLMVYPKEPLLSIIRKNKTKKLKLLKILNELTQNEFIEQGRVYGGGMRKFEPKELSEVDSSKIEIFIREENTTHNNT